MTSDTHGPTFSLLAGVLKRKRYSTSKFRQTRLKLMFNLAKGERSRRKGKHPVTLPERPFDWRDGDQ